MINRDLSLSARVEGVRESQRILIPVHFTKEEIKEHFFSSIESIKSQFAISDNLFNEGREEECKIIWRSQVVLAEGLLDFYMHDTVCFKCFVEIGKNLINMRHLWFRCQKLRRQFLQRNLMNGFLNI